MSPIFTKVEDCTCNFNRNQSLVGSSDNISSDPNLIGNSGIPLTSMSMESAIKTLSTQGDKTISFEFAHQITLWLRELIETRNQVKELKKENSLLILKNKEDV